MKNYVRTLGGTFMEGFRNKDGSPRKAKVMLDLNIIEPIYKINFS